MSARTQRTLLRLLAVFLAAGAGDAIVQFAASTNYDWRHLAAALVAAAVIAAEQFLKNTGDNASPTVAAVNAALQPVSITAMARGVAAPSITTAGQPRTVAPPSAAPSE